MADAMPAIMTPTSRITLATVIAAVLTGDRWELFGCRSPFENFVAEEPCCANQAQTLRNSMRAGRSLKRVAAQAHVRSRPKRPCNATLGGAIQNGHAACPDRLSLKSNPCSQANRPLSRTTWHPGAIENLAMPCRGLGSLPWSASLRECFACTKRSAAAAGGLSQIA